MISGHQEFLFLAIWWAGYFFPFFSLKLFFTFVLHAISFFLQALARNFFSKSPTPPPSRVKWSAPKQGLCKAKLPFFATSLHKSLSFHFSNAKEKACQLNYTSVVAVFIELRCQYQFCCFIKWMFFTLFINGTLKSMTVNI